MNNQEFSAIKNAIRVGEISSVNSKEYTARVIFHDKEKLVSAPLKVLGTPSPWLPKVGQYVVCIYLINGESDGFILGVI